MSTREDLEAALRARPDESTLLVYADLLQAQGDPRGELIALDLRPPDRSSAGLERRRGQLLAAWLGDELDIQLDTDTQRWHAGELDATYATFDCGLVDLVIDDAADDAVVAHVLRGPAGHYLRRVSITGDWHALDRVLSHLVGAPRPWLQHLALAQPDHARPRPHAAAAQLAAATPNLEVLDLLGRDLLGAFTHPNVRELGITGCESIDLVAGPPLPALHAIDFAFDGDRPTPRGLFSPARVPALRRLCVSREEPGARAFEALGTLGVAAQLTHVELPSLRSMRDHALGQAGLDRMPALRELVIARAYAMFEHVAALRHPHARITSPPSWPWPPREACDRRLSIDAHTVDLAELVEVLEAHHAELPELERSVWDMFWRQLARGPVEGEHAFHSPNLLAALDALQLPPRLAALRDDLRGQVRSLGAGCYTTLRWA